jgi:hypothetical protein
MTISMLKSIAMQRPKLPASSTSRASHAGQVWCADLIIAQGSSFSFYVLALVGFGPLLGLFEV